MNKTIGSAIAGLVCLALLARGVFSAPDIDIKNKLALTDICAMTDFKEACQKAIGNAQTKQPRELFKVVLNYTADALATVIRNSSTFREAASNKATKDALDVCDIVLDHAISDLKRSFALIGDPKHDSMAELMDDLKTWLSAVMTYQETCIDAFAKTPSETAVKMRRLLKSTKELSSNALAIAISLGNLLSSVNLGSFKLSRKLFSGQHQPHQEERQKLLFDSEPSAIVAADGSGKFKTIKEAIATIPAANNETFLIKIKAGVYNEQVDIPKGMNKVIFLGEGVDKTRITCNKNFVGGVKTYFSATLGINGYDFMAKDLTVENTAGPEGQQAVAVRASGDRTLFYNVNMEGYQDTLFAHVYRQFYSGCKITGTIDFVFGDALAVFQKCEFVARKGMAKQENMVTAQGRTDEHSQTGIFIQGCKIMAEADLLSADPAMPSYLGRPWKEFSRTFIMQTTIDGFIKAEGWAEWMGDYGVDTCYYVEYQNKGEGAKLDGRVKWKGIKTLTADQMADFTAQKLFGVDDWIKDSGAPYTPGMMTA